MRTAGPKTKGWKDALLRTSLPLEQVVAEEVSAQGLYVGGEYTYTRLNEQNIETEFSVDLWAFELFRRDEHTWANFNALIECKYNYPGVTWIFAEHPNPRDVIAGVITTLDAATAIRLAEKPLYRLDNSLHFCVKGVELHSDDANPQSISRAINQLLYAAPHLAVQSIIRQLNEWNDEDLAVELICSIVATTATLRTLKQGLDLPAFQSATNLDTISDEVDALVVYRPLGAQLYSYATKLSAEPTREAERQRVYLKELRSVLEKANLKPHELPDGSSFRWEVGYVCERVLVVNLSSLGPILRRLRRSVQDAVRGGSKFARLERNINERKRWFVPTEPDNEKDRKKRGT